MVSYILTTILCLIFIRKSIITKEPLVKYIATATNMPHDFRSKNVRATMQLRYATKKKTQPFSCKTQQSLLRNCYEYIRGNVLLRFATSLTWVSLYINILSQSARKKQKNKLATNRFIASRGQPTEKKSHQSNPAFKAVINTKN